MSIAELFKEVQELVGPNEEVVELKSVTGEGRVIGLYFSAHWCPPCRSVLIPFILGTPLSSHPFGFLVP